MKNGLAAFLCKKLELDTTNRYNDRKSLRKAACYAQKNQ